MKYYKNIIFVLFSVFFFQVIEAQEGSVLKSKNESPNLLAFGIGDYNVLHPKSSYHTGMVQLEYKGPNFFGKKIVKIRPFAAFLVNFQGSLWAGAGVNFDIYLTKPVVLTLGLGPGYFYKGKGKNLGYPLEIRSSIELAYQFKSYSRVGFQFYHLSNASFSSKNPGSESLIFFYAIPI